MRIGKEKHEKILEDTINKLKKEGYKTICLDGKSPTAVAVKDGVSYAVCILGRTKNKNGRWKRTKTITYLEDWYDMFDNIVRINFNLYKTEQKEKLEEVLNDYRKRGFNIIPLVKKSPDAIAIKNDTIFAIEIIGIQQGGSGQYRIKCKEEIYDMFDGLMIKTFNYDNDVVFTETFGRNKIGGN